MTIDPMAGNARTFISDTWTYLRHIYICVAPPDKTTVYIIKKMLASAPQIIGYCQHCTPSLKLYF